MFSGSIDGRDAIIEADDLLNNGDNYCLLWKSFAKRGLGVNADQGSNNDRFDQVEDFGLPTVCTLGLTETEVLEFVQVFPNPAKDLMMVQSIEQN